MVEIICDDSQIVADIERLLTLLQENGSQVHPGLKLVSSDAGLSLLAPDGAHPGEPLIKLSPSCLLPLEDFTFALAGDDIVLRTQTAAVSPLQLELMQTLISLYNHSGKIAFHRRTNPWVLAQQDREFLRHITAGRGMEAFAETLSHLDDEPEQFLLHSFFKSRRLDHLTDSGRQHRVLMPVIDFLNHHYAGAPFAIDEAGDGAIAVGLKLACPVPGSRECFARYGLYDAYDALLSYGYVEHDAPFVRSVPLRITLDLERPVTLDIQAVVGEAGHRNLRARYRDLAFYLPAYTLHSDRMEVSYLLIPQDNAPYALRRVLDILIRILAPTLANDRVAESVSRAERAILDENLRFYDDLDGYLDGVDPAEDGHGTKEPERQQIVALAREMVAIQRERIRHYPLLRQRGTPP